MLRSRGCRYEPVFVFTVGYTAFHPGYGTRELSKMMSDIEPMPSEVKYPYMGVPLTPAIAQALVKRLFAGKLVERQVIVDEVVRAHQAGGGLKAKANDLSSLFKKALATMKETGEAENTSVGYWRIHAPQSQIDMNTPVFHVETPSAAESSAVEAPAGTNIQADIEIGSGAGAIYMYYLPMYRIRAQERGEKV